MSDDISFMEINEAKIDLNHIYNQPDPRAYFRELGKLDYSIPDAAKPIFKKLISHLNDRNGETVHVLDIGCSYGVNAALLKHDMTMSQLYEHWSQKVLAGAAPEDVVAYDRRFFDSFDKSDLEVFGVDQAENAIAFAEESGLLDKGVVANLETQPLPDRVEQELASVDLVISTGCVGYVTEKSFDRLLPAVTQNRAPWIGNFVLRLFPFDAIDRTLSDWGYVTERLEGQTFVQRRFSGADEQAHVLQQLRQHGVDPAGKEAEGHFHAEFYLSRPAEEASELPLGKLFAA